MSIHALRDRVLARDPRTVNTDWDGSLIAAGLIEWGSVTGDPAYGRFVRQWFRDHQADSATMTDEAFHQTYQGPNARVIRGAPLLLSGYSGHWGVGYVCLGLDRLLGDEDARTLSVMLARYLTTEAGRNEQGCLLHDDAHDFVIPDTAYLAAPALAVAAQLSGDPTFLDEAVRQVLLPARLLQDDRTGLAFTMWTPTETPRVFWSRASGWLAGAIANTLPFVPETHPDRPELIQRFQRLADGLARVQTDDGGFHVLLNDPSTPTDPTGPALIGAALRRGSASGWLEPSAGGMATAAWDAVASFLTADGSVRGVYTGWALPALRGDLGSGQFDNPPDRDFALGLVLLAGAAESGATSPVPPAAPQGVSTI